MDNQEIEKILDDFFAGDMSNQEERNFFDLIEQNDDLRKAYQLENRIKQNALLLNDRAYDKNIRNTHEKYITENDKSNSMTMKTWLSIAASLVILAAAYFLLTTDPNQGEDQKENYLSYLIDYETTSLGKFALRGSDTEEETLKDTLALALHESTSGSMDKALILLKELFARHPNNEEVQLYLGIQYYKSSNFKTAIPMLNSLVMSDNVDIREEAEMALAMASTSLGDKSQLAEKWLRKIAKDPDHRHKDMAEMQLSFYD